MKTTLFKGAAVAFPLLFGTAVNAQDTYTYNYTGDVQTYTVPAGITSIQIEVWGAQGQASDIEITAREILKLKDELYQIIAKHSGQKIEKVNKDSDRDYWMKAQEAKSYGMVDEVLKK